MRRSVLVAGIALCTTTLALPAQAGGTPRGEFALLVAASLEIARTGNGDASRDVLAAMAALGMPAAELAAHRGAAEKALQRARRQGPTTRAARLLREAVDALGAELPQRTGEAQRHLAEVLLQLDSEFAPAHELLGHERLADRWHPAGAAHRDRNRKTLAAAIDRARHLEIPMTTGASDETLLTEALGQAGVCVRSGTLELHAAFTAPKAERIVRQTLRAAAFVNFLVAGKLEVPDYGRQKSVLFRTHQQYLDAITKLVAKGIVPKEHADTARGVGSWRIMQVDPMLQVAAYDMEADAEAIWLATLEYWRGKYPSLIAGRVDFAERLLLGTPFPRMTEVVVRSRAGDGARTRSAAAAAERARLEVLSAAGMRGGRAWMRYLVREHEAPPWTATLHDQVATLAGDELLKATLVVEFLVEEGRFQGLAEAAEQSGKADQEEAFAAALGEPLADFDRRWRQWLVGFDDGVLQRLQAKPKPSAADVAAERVLAAVRELRERAGLRDPLEHDAELAAGCREHAVYLQRNPDQTTSWPEMHEEYADRPGWTSTGAMAGHAAVIAPGCRTDEQALAAWMATFYHRVPLLDFGLRRIGYARDGDIAVLDCGSMVAPRYELHDTVVLWPYNGMTETPTRFAPELPNPVPGEDQARFGYPITVQCSARSSRLPVELHMVLREKDARGPEVPCWFSSPQAPSNPVLAPANTFCLIPQEPLKKGATYHVTAEFVGEGGTLQWTFRT